MEQVKLKFEFTVEEANAILGAFGQMLDRGAGLVENMRQQAAPQVQPAQASVEVPAPQEVQ